MSRNPEEPSSLSPRCAFVVHFRPEARAEQQRHWTGRVEHMASGHAARFESLDQLWAFITQALSENESR